MGKRSTRLVLMNTKVGHQLLLVQSVPTHSSWARAVAVNDKYIAVGYKPDNTIKIYDKSTLRLVRTLTGHTGSVFHLPFTGCSF